MELPIADIAPDPDQPRKRFDSASLEELAASISALGVLQPIAVRRGPSGWIIVAGERRWRAAALAGLATIPAYEVELDSVEVREAALVENIQREQLTPVEEARAFQALVEAHGSVTEVAQRVGKSRAAVSNTMRLLKLSPAALGAIHEGKLSPGHGILLLQIEDPQMQEDACARAVSYGMTVKQLQGYIKDLGYSAGPGASSPRPPPRPARHEAVVCPECFCEFEVSR